MNTRTPARWRKSSYSDGNTNCVEVARTPELAAVRDSKDRTRGRITVAARSWSALLSTLR